MAEAREVAREWSDAKVCAPTGEWLEADGLGGFASGTIEGPRSRRYHGLLLVAQSPPVQRTLLVSGFDAFIVTPRGRLAITSQRYTPDVLAPDAGSRRLCFRAQPWPRWRFQLDGGTVIEQEIFVHKASGRTVVRWCLCASSEAATLEVRPFLCGRDYHALHHENPAFQFTPEVEGERLLWRPYHGVPPIVMLANAHYEHDPQWYRNFSYREEEARGLDSVEDLAAPGILRWDLSGGREAVWILGTELPAEAAPARVVAEQLREEEIDRRRQFTSSRERAADDYVVRRGSGQSIIAGYPWFTDWGRDTFIALRGLCIATGRLDLAARILTEWSTAVSEGMLPNRFPDRGETPEYNAVDASLWFVVCVQELKQALAKQHRRMRADDVARLDEAVHDILAGYADGTRHGIRADSDGLLAAGAPGVQLTWMDAKIGDWVVTPRVGKPVEVEALWLNALAVGAHASQRFRDLFEQGSESFRERFWNAQAGCLYDVIDVDHRAGVVDATIRPNQILAVGGLPLAALLPRDQATRVVGTVYSRLYTPVGLRSLAPFESGYAPRYEGSVRERDAAYHQGTVWPWLLGPFVEAWVRVGGPGARSIARKRFLEPMLARLDPLGTGHLAEIADAEAPHTSRGCPFQAWSLGEALRLDLVVLSDGLARGRDSHQGSPSRMAGPL
jgi:predicted glycogen debranching enzyme